MTTQTSKFNFLSSRKFWALVIIAILGVLKAELVLDAAIVDPLIALAYGFIGVNLVTKTVDKL